MMDNRNISGNRKPQKYKDEKEYNDLKFSKNGFLPRHRSLRLPVLTDEYRKSDPIMKSRLKVNGEPKLGKKASYNLLFSREHRGDHQITPTRYTKLENKPHLSSRIHVGKENKDIVILEQYYRKRSESPTKENVSQNHHRKRNDSPINDYAERTPRSYRNTTTQSNGGQTSYDGRSTQHYESQKPYTSNTTQNYDRITPYDTRTTQTYDRTTKYDTQTTQYHERTTQSHDRTTQSYDRTRQSHDRTTQSHDRTTQSYDRTRQSHDKTTHPYDKTTAYDRIPTGSYDDTIPYNSKSTVSDNKTTLQGTETGQSESKENKVTKASYVKLQDLTTKEVYNDTLHRTAAMDTKCGHQCLGSMMSTLKTETAPDKLRPKDELIQQAQEFMEQYFKSTKRNGTTDHTTRWKEVMDSIDRTGSYSLTYEELVFGTKLAWRNSPRCIGRIQWSNLQVFDARDVKTTQEMFDAICRHLEWATNNGKIRSAITIFRQRIDDSVHDFRIYNQQLINYAGYKQPDGSVIGDPGMVEFTQFCVELGWKARNGRFDVLPLVLQANGKEPELFEIPKELILEVAISHPKYPGFESLGLKWFGLPAVSALKFDCGGLEFPASPFNGWYMSSEVASRDFLDTYRYNQLENVAKVLGLDTRNNVTLWKDKAAVEMNIAVLHSYQSAGVTMVDHHTASESFMTFLQNEYKTRGGCPSDWIWIVPPINGSLCPVFHQEMSLYKLKPGYEYQDEIWRTYLLKKHGMTLPGKRKRLRFKVAVRVITFCAVLMKKSLSKRVKCTILYATETGKSEKYARTLNEIFKHSFNSRVMCMENYNVEDFLNECLMFFVTSTFGDGDPPENGKIFSKQITKMRDLEVGKSGVANNNKVAPRRNGIKHTNVLHHIKYSVFGLGSSAYPDFCAFSHFLDTTMTVLGAEKIHDLGEGDELCGQEESFRKWAKQVIHSACKKFKVGNRHDEDDASDVLDQNDMTWKQGKFKLVPASPGDNQQLSSVLSEVYSKVVYSCTLKEKKQLELKKSSRHTILAKINLGTNKIRYSPGDHVLLFPRNQEGLVHDILKKLHNAPPSDQLIKVERVHDYGKVENTGYPESFSQFDHFPPATLKDLMSRFLDITTPPTQDFLKHLSSQACDEKDRNKLKHLANHSDSYTEWKSRYMPTLLDVLESFSSLKVCPTFLLTQLPILQPRYYSISSAQDFTPGEIHVTADVVEYKTPNGDRRKGVCTNWLNSLLAGDEILCAVRRAPLFHMPKDVTVPVIMVGPGTGIAPFRSFWMQRKVEKTRNIAHHSSHKSTWGDMVLYFGCRYATIDNIYKDELEQMEKEKVLTECFFAYSREPDQKKTYVQDLLRKNGNDVYKKIMIEKGHIYICGNVQMATDVKSTLQDIIQHCSKMTPESAQQWIEKLKEENRLHEDIFGLANKSKKDRESAKKSISTNKTTGDIVVKRRNPAYDYHEKL